MLSFFKDLFGRYGSDDIAGKAAALAYYAIFCIGPLLFIIFGVIGEVLKNESTKERLVSQMHELMGPEAGALIDGVVNNSTLTSKTGVAFLIGGVGLLLGGIGIFGQLQKSLNNILHVKTGPDAGLRPIFVQKLLSLGLVGVIVFMLLVSLVASAAISVATSQLEGERFNGALFGILDFTASIVILSLLLALLYRTLPAVKLPWRAVLATSAVVAVFFSLGKSLLGLIIGNNANITAFGAAGSLVALLLWIFYTGQIIYLGAAGLSVYAERSRVQLVPRYKGPMGVLRIKQVEKPVKPGFSEVLAEKFAEGFERGLKSRRKK